MSSSASEVQVLVDDFDPRITYTPADGWRTMGSDTEFNSTTHALLEGTGSFRFNFNGSYAHLFSTQLQIEYTISLGTGIIVLTTVPAVGASETIAEVICKVDGAIIYTFSDLETGYHKRACQTSALSVDREHLLEVEVSRTSAGPPFYFDYLICNVIINLEDEDVDMSILGPGGKDVRIIVDDSDERIVYQPDEAWGQEGVENEYGGMTHITNAAGATAMYT